MDTRERTHVGHQTTAQTLVPADPEDVDRVGLHRVDRDVEGDVFPRVHARHRGIALHLAARVRRLVRDLPGTRARLLILIHDGVGPRRRRPGHAVPATEHAKAGDEYDAKHPVANVSTDPARPFRTWPG